MLLNVKLLQLILVESQLLSHACDRFFKGRNLRLRGDLDDCLVCREQSLADVDVFVELAQLGLVVHRVGFEF